jgi:predicted amidohydrolase YtcJ
MSDLSRLALTNGSIWTGDGNRFNGSVIIEAGVIKSVIPGPLPDAIDCPVIDAKGGSILPAFTDVHVHFSQVVKFNLSVDLARTKSKAEAIDLLLERSRAINDPTQWIVGMNLQEEKWSEPVLPTRWDLDAVPNPTMVVRNCLHTRIANSLAIEFVGESKFGFSENIFRDAEGRLTGIFKEAEAWIAFAEVLDSDPPEGAFRELCDQCVRFGLAEVHPICDVGIEYYEKLNAAKPLPLKFRFYRQNLELKFSMPSGTGNSKFSYGGYKIFIDGGVGSRTAAVREPYLDVHTSGILNFTDSDLYNSIKAAFESDVQVMTHCIGDAGLDQLLNVLEKLKADGCWTRWPFKLTHLEVSHKDQVKRIAQLGCFCDMQPHMIPSDSDLLVMILGPERASECFPIGSMVEAGIVVAGASDSPVEPIDPLTGIWGAVVRTPAMNLAERLTLDEALKMYTINAQKLIMKDKEKGLIEPGYVADIVVFEDDLFAIDPNDLRQCKVAATIIDGRVAYSRSQDSG